MKIYIVRHGETEANKEGLLQGTLDTPLTENGLLLAKLTGEGLKDIKFDAVYSSPLKRASDTAKIILKENKCSNPIIKYDERIAEVNMGTWEGKHIKGKELEIDENKLKMFMQNPLNLGRFPNGETAHEVIERTHDFLLDLVKHHEYQNVLVSTHGFALRALLNFLYDNPDDFWQGHVPYNCCVNVIEYNGEMFEFVDKDLILYDKNLIVDRYKI